MYDKVELHCRSVSLQKAEIGAEGTGKGYRRWIREPQRPRYSTTFNFLARVLGEENAYVALPALVRAAFCTTHPLEVFASLVAMTVRWEINWPTYMGIDKY